MREFIAYKQIKPKDCLHLSASWRKIAFKSYGKFRKKAEKEQPPSLNVLLTGVLQALVSNDRFFIDKAVELVDGNVPDDGILALSGSALYDMGKHEEGLERLRKAVKLNPTPANMEALAGSLETPENNSEKLELANRILESDPNHVDGLRHKAFVLVQLNQIDEAEKLLRKAHRVSHGNADVKEALGEIMFKRGMYKEALQLYEKAYSCSYRSKYSWQQIALCYLELGKLNKAKRAALEMLKVAKRGENNLDTPEMKAFLNKFGVVL